MSSIDSGILMKIKHHFFIHLVFLFCFCEFSNGQIKIGDNPEQIDTSSLLELEGVTKAFVLSRVTDGQMQLIQPLSGALVYNTDFDCVFYFNGSAWENLCENTGSGGNLSIEDNGDGTYTIDNNIDAPITFDGAPETTTQLVDNSDGSFTYFNEAGEETTINTGIVGGEHTGTPGSVFFANSTTGGPTEDNAQFFWDNVNKRLGIGTNTPVNILDVNGIMRTRRINNVGGTIAFPGYHFRDNSDSGMFSDTDSGDIGFSTNTQELMRLTNGQRVGIKVSNPQATLHVGGDLIVDGTITNGNGTVLVSKTPSGVSGIRRVSRENEKINLDDHTVILENGVAQIILPTPSKSNIGKILIIKDLGGVSTKLNIPFKDLVNKNVNTIEKARVIWIQSDGLEWQQIN